MKKDADSRVNKGFTLVELLVALLISGMLLATVSSVFLMSQKIYTRGENTSYKQKSITNVETDLQNALSRAKSVTLNSNPKGDYNIGFNDKGQCIEKIGTSGTAYIVDQISGINLLAQPTAGVYTMRYQLIPIKVMNMSTLTGGIVMNNIKIVNSDIDPNLVAADFVPIKTVSEYLVIIYATAGT
ncbi:MAG: PilW family protein [Acetobacterium sp.]